MIGFFNTEVEYNENKDNNLLVDIIGNLVYNNYKSLCRYEFG